MLKNKKPFIILLVAHFLISISSIFITVGWSMAILDLQGSKQAVAPFGLQVLGIISIIFNSPWYFLRQIPNLFSGDPFNPFWKLALVLFVNSLLVAYLVALILEKVLGKKGKNK